MKRILFFFLLTAAGAKAQKITTKEYIEKYKDLAIQEMRRSGVPADITLAQGVLETESGNSDLVKRSNNHFGIKCKENWKGESVTHDDDEKGECFRKYPTAADSYRDHSDFLRNRPYYSALFKLDPTDYKAWAHGLKKAGYATNKDYAKILIRTIEDYHLNSISKQIALEISGQTQVAHVEEKSVETPAVPPANTAIQEVKTTNTQVVSTTKFNGLIAHFAKAGISYTAIANQYNIPLANLLAFNDQKKDGQINEDKWIYLEAKNIEGKRETYITTTDLTVEEIAHVNAIQLDKLLQYNGWKAGEKIKLGTVVRLKSTNSSSGKKSI